MAKHKPFSEQLRAAVSRAGETRYWISKETGIDEGTVSRFARGKAGLSLHNVDILFDYLGLRVVNPKHKDK
jgi:hypothetical protein